MALRIQTNIAALTSHRNLTASDANMSKSLERLSSGYRINRAADDAAGLSISEGFRADIASFKVASRNTTEANALLQVAEGGMEQIGNMLTRLKELSTQAASANVGSSERVKLNAEGNALISEIDRIASSTKYGSTNLLNGTFGAITKSTAMAATTGAFAAAGVTASYGMVGSSYNAYEFTTVPVSVLSGTGQLTVAAIGAAITEGTWYIAAAVTASAIVSTATSYSIQNNAIYSAATIRETYTLSAGTWSSVTALNFANLGITVTMTAAASFSGVASMSAASGLNLAIRRTGITTLDSTDATSGVYTIYSGSAGVSGGIKITDGTLTQELVFTATGAYDFNELGISLTLDSNYADQDLAGFKFTVTNTNSGNNTFQIGAKNDSYNQISLSITGVTAATLNTGLVVNMLDDQTEAQSMLTTIDSAISALTSARGSIGASMNRLAYAAANLATTVENMQAADSVIRDVDMAAEMTNFTKQQILMQAGTAMLAQANQAPQLILSLMGQ